MKIIESLAISGPCYRSGRKIKVRGLMLHSVGCPQPKPEVFARKWNRPDYRKACCHGVIGADEAIITLPCMDVPGEAWRGWHCGGEGNNGYIGIEMCEPACIRYTRGARFSCSDAAEARAYVEAATENAVSIFARLCAFHDIDPLTGIISHREGAALGIASHHADPEHLWHGLEMDWTMDSFRQAVYNKIEEDDEMTDEEFAAHMERYLAALKEQPPSDWSADARQWAEDNGIIFGDENGRKQYKAFCTREQLAIMLHRLKGDK